MIGRNASGTAPLSNRKTGITVASNGNTIGGAGPGAGNTIASNGFFGVSIREQSIQRIPILSNSIFSNAQLGINLSGNDSSPYGVTLNDPGDGDGFVANQGQNFPEISDASVTGSKATVSGKLNSTASTTFRLEFFASAACDPSGYGEGQTFIGSTSVTTESDGNQNFTFTSSDEFEVPVGQSVITSTATDPINNTSEFSKCLTATGAPPNTAPEATDDPNTPGDPNYTTNEGTPLTVSAANGVLANDLDPNSDPLTAVKVSNPTNGTVTLNANGSFVYTPNNDFTGTDSFTYKANDGQADSNVATVTVNVQGTGGDTTRPTVFSVDPPQGKTGVPRTNNITVTFSEEMDTSTFDADTVKLTQGSTSIPVTMTTSTDSLGRTVLTLDPFGPTTQKLGKKKTYTVRIEGANDVDGFAVKDLASNELAADYVSSFKTKRR